MTIEPRFFVADIRQAKICMSGAREYFAARDWDWADFLENGRSLADLAVQGDVYSDRIVNNIKERDANG